jgi:hypothetical protein
MTLSLLACLLLWNVTALVTTLAVESSLSFGAFAGEQAHKCAKCRWHHDQCDREEAFAAKRKPTVSA